VTYEKFKKRAADLYSELETLQDFYKTVKDRTESQLGKRTDGEYRDFLVEAITSSEEEVRQAAQDYHELYPQ
jgi:HEAT repeat protein